jgi:cytidylate kinase
MFASATMISRMRLTTQNKQDLHSAFCVHHSAFIKMIITIDGPAGTGKSTVAHAVAERLSFDFLDTGAMYRAIGLAALRREIDLEDARELTFVARLARLEFDWSFHPPRLLLNGESVGHQLRGGDCTRAASCVAVVPAIREMLVNQQRQIGAERGNMVTEGRDQGTIVFPDAELKIYLDAAPAERARRRVSQLRARGEIVDFKEILTGIESRDRRDATRSVGPMSVPQNALVIDTTLLHEPQVVDRIVAKAEALRVLEAAE